MDGAGSMNTAGLRGQIEVFEQHIAAGTGQAELQAEATSISSAFTDLEASGEISTELAELHKRFDNDCEVLGDIQTRTASVASGVLPGGTNPPAAQTRAEGSAMGGALPRVSSAEGLEGGEDTGASHPEITNPQVRKFVAKAESAGDKKLEVCKEFGDIKKWFGKDLEDPGVDEFKVYKNNVYVKSARNRLQDRKGNDAGWPKDRVYAVKRSVEDAGLELEDLAMTIGQKQNSRVYRGGVQYFSWVPSKNSIGAGRASGVGKSWPYLDSDGELKAATGISENHNPALYPDQTNYYRLTVDEGSDSW